MKFKLFSFLALLFAISLLPSAAVAENPKDETKVGATEEKNDQVEVADEAVNQVEDAKYYGCRYRRCCGPYGCRCCTFAEATQEELNQLNDVNQQDNSGGTVAGGVRKGPGGGGSGRGGSGGGRGGGGKSGGRSGGGGSGGGRGGGGSGGGHGGGSSGGGGSGGGRGGGSSGGGGGRGGGSGGGSGGRRGGGGGGGRGGGDGSGYDGSETNP